MPSAPHLHPSSLPLFPAPALCPLSPRLTAALRPPPHANLQGKALVTVLGRALL